MKKKLCVAVLCMLPFVLSACFHREKPQPVSLTFYGLDDSDVFSSIMKDYQNQNAHVTIKYKKFTDPVVFENLMVNEIAEGEGPDIFYIHNTWLPRHSKKLVPLQSEKFTPQQFSETFVSVAAEDFIQPDPQDGNKKIYALPLYVDTLALYYNKKHFEQQLPERGKPGATWKELEEDAAKLRQQDEGGKLTRGAYALGRADNIKLAADILYHLFLQAGVRFYDSEFKRVELGGSAEDYFEYFLHFAIPQNKQFSWNPDLVPEGPEAGELEAFLAGKVSAMFGYSDLYPRLETELKNVKARLFSDVSLKDIGVAPSPQISDDKSEYKVWAHYYGLAVSRNAKNPAAAWDFIQFATSKEAAAAYHKETKRPAARRDLIEEQKKEPVTDVFVSQVGYAGSFRIFSDQKFAEFLKEAITAANNGQNPRGALNGAVTKMNELLSQEAPEGLYPKPKRKK